MINILIVSKMEVMLLVSYCTRRTVSSPNLNNLPCLLSFDTSDYAILYSKHRGMSYIAANSVLRLFKKLPTIWYMKKFLWWLTNWCSNWQRLDRSICVLILACTIFKLLRISFQFVCKLMILYLKVIEHVADPAEFCKSLAELTNTGGATMVSTINRSMRAYATAIVAAEYLLHWVWFVSLISAVFCHCVLLIFHLEFLAYM